MKTTVAILFLFVFNSSIAQVSGDIVVDKREVTQEFDYTIPYSKPGTLVFNITVNADGKVTSCVLDEQKSTITSTGPMMKAKNKIMAQLVFQKGTSYPQWHKGFVEIRTVQTIPSNSGDFSPPK